MRRLEDVTVVLVWILLLISSTDSLTVESECSKITEMVELSTFHHAKNNCTQSGHAPYQDHRNICAFKQLDFLDDSWSFTRVYSPLSIKWDQVQGTLTNGWMPSVFKDCQDYVPDYCPHKILWTTTFGVCLTANDWDQMDRVIEDFFDCAALLAQLYCEMQGSQGKPMTGISTFNNSTRTHKWSTERDPLKEDQVVLGEASEAGVQYPEESTMKARGNKDSPAVRSDNGERDPEEFSGHVSRNDFNVKVPEDQMVFHNVDPSEGLKFQSFVLHPCGNKGLDAIYGVNPTLKDRLLKAGFDEASDVIEQYNLLDRNHDNFKAWLKSLTKVNSRFHEDITRCIAQWCRNFPEECNALALKKLK